MTKRDCPERRPAMSRRSGGEGVSKRRLLAAGIVAACLVASSLTAQTGGTAREAATDSLKRDLLRVVKAEMEYW